MRRTGEAVVADDTVRDEILGLRRNVIEAHRLAKRLNTYHLQLRIALDGLAFEVQLPSDRRVHRVEEAQMFLQSAKHSDHIDRFSVWVRLMLNNESKAQRPQGRTSPRDDFRVRIRDSKDGLAKTAFGIKDPSQKANTPALSRSARP